MKKIILFTVIIFLSNACFKGKSADIIIHNAKVHTMNENTRTAEAIAIKDGKIIAVGSEREILNEYHSKNIVNAEKKDVYPGLHDAHGHIMSLARQRLIANLTETRSYEDMLNRLDQFYQTHTPPVIQGRGWDQSLWESSNLPTFEQLNARFPNTPVALTRIDGHAMLVNQKMLDIAGINADTEVDGGKVVLKDGELTGLLLDHAIDLVGKHIPAPKKEDVKKAILTIQNELVGLGITHIHEAGITFDDLMLLNEMADSNQLTVNIYAMLFPTKRNKNFTSENGHYRNGKLSVRSFKILMDGALGSYGACLLHPYASNPDETGFLLTSIEEMNKHTAFAKEHNYQVNTHCIGDSANRIMLHRIHNLMSDENDHRWRIEHAQVVHPNDFDLFDKSGALPSVQPTHATSDQRWAEKHIGTERLQGAYAYKTLLETRKMILFGTDFPVENFDPFATIHAAVQRKTINDEPLDGFLTEEAVSLNQTLKAMTIWAAFGCFEEKNVGTIEKGKKANIVIFDQQVSSSPSYMPNFAAKTFIEGELVYDIDEL